MLFRGGEEEAGESHQKLTTYFSKLENTYLGVEKRRRRLDVLDKKVHKTEEPLVKSSWCLIKLGVKLH